MASTGTSEVEFGILGPLEVRVGGTAVPMRQGLTRAVLLALLLRANRTVSTDALIEDLYGDDLPAHPLNALQVQVSYLRRALAEAGAADLVVTEATGYRLAVPPAAVDAHRFEALVAESRALTDEADRGSLPAAVHCLDEALALWRGEPLSDVAYRDFAAGEVARLEELRLEAFERKAEVRLRLGHHREVTGDLRGLVDEHPLRERPRELLILALYRAGRQTEALREHEAIRRLLGDELGLEPGPELRRLERAILDQDPALDWASEPSRLGDRPTYASGRRTGAPVAPPPAPVTSIIGRSADLERLASLLERSRSVTLTGPGGAGKTRLAIEHAQVEDGACWFVDLGPLSDPAAVAVEIATAFGLTVRSGDDPLAGIPALAPDGLLVLDTCEHLVVAASDAVARLLRGCPALRVLATSRRPLELAGELTCPVAPLDLPDAGAAADRISIESSPAVQLLVERAKGVRPDFALSGESVADVAAIVAALDGLPLAIELAAARLDVLSPAELRQRLSDRFSLLNAGSRDATARQRSLRAALDWSYELLTEEERVLFQRLAVLPGPFTLDLACALVEGHVSAAPLDLVQALIRQSMVTRFGAEAFGILDTLQAYAAERADAIDTGRALQALGDWAVETSKARDRALRGPDQLTALAGLRRDLPNLRLALEWSLVEGNDPVVGARIAARLGWFWHLTGMFEEGSRWTRLAAAVPEASPDVRVAVLIGAGLHTTDLGHLDEARAYLSDAVAVAEVAGSPGFLPSARAHRGGMEWWFDQPDDADADLSFAARASAPGSAMAHPWVHAFALLHLGRVRLRQERYDDANALFDQAEPFVRDVGDRYLSELAVRFRARGATLQGAPEAAVALAAEALQHAEQLGHAEGIAISLLALGEAQRALGRLDEAEVVLRRGVELGVAADHLGSACQSLALLAAIDADRGETDTAARLVRDLLAGQAAAGLPLLTPGSVVQGLVNDLLGGKYPKRASVDAAGAARGRDALRALAVAYLAETATTHSEESAIAQRSGV